MSARANWEPSGSTVLVVAGKAAREQALLFGVYQCPNRRSFRPSHWMAFSAEGQIDTYAEIDGVPEDDVIIADRPELAELAEHMVGKNGDPHKPTTLIRLTNVAKIGPISNDKIDNTGRRTAWVQSQRYTRIERLRSAKWTSDL